MSVHVHFTKAAAILSALAGTVLLAPSTASAEERPVFVYGEAANARTELVPFASLNLATARDQKRLRHRVGAAVERVCLRDIGRDGLQDGGYYACESNAWGAASPQIAAAVSKASDLALNGGSPIAATAIIVSAF